MKANAMMHVHMYANLPHMYAKVPLVLSHGFVVAEARYRCCRYYG